MGFLIKVNPPTKVSHWGNIYVEESYKLENQGAEFKGEYSRVDFSPHDRNTGFIDIR